MIQVETSVLIQCPLETVLAFVSDSRNNSTWQFGMSRIAPATSLVSQSVAETWLPLQTLTPVPENSRNAKLGELNRTSTVQTCSNLVTCDAAYNFEPVDSSTYVTWTGRVSARDRYRAVEALIGQIVVLQAEASLALLKNLLEPSGYWIPIVQRGMGQRG